jgi:hypothetical protein
MSTGSSQVRIERRHGCRHARGRCDRATRIAAPIDRLREDGAGAALGHGELDVVGLARADPEFLDRDRLDRLPVGRYDRQLDPGDPHVEERRRPRADEAQAHALAGRGDTGPVAGGRRAVHQIGVGRGRDIAVVGRVHPRAVPHPPPLERLAQAHGADILEEIAGGRLRKIIVAALLLEIEEDLQRRLVRPVAEHDAIVAIGRPRRRRLFRLDDDRSIESRLLGERVSVIPVGSALADLEAIGEGLTRRDAGKADAGHAVHLRRHDDAVPMDARHLLEAVAHAQRDRVAFAQAQDRRGHAAVHGGRDTALAGEVDRQLGDLEVELGPAQLSGRDWGGSREKRRGETGDRAADRQPLDELAPRNRAGVQVEHGSCIFLEQGLPAAPGAPACAISPTVRVRWRGGVIFTRELGQDRSGTGFTARDQNLVPVRIVVFAWAISKSLRRGHRLANRVALALHAMSSRRAVYVCYEAGAWLTPRRAVGGRLCGLAVLILLSNPTPIARPAR